MPLASHIMTEPMTREELGFVRKKFNSDARQFYRAMNRLMVLAFVCPFVYSFYKLAVQDPEPFSMKEYFTGVIGLLLFLALCAGIAYKFTLNLLRKDLVSKNKIIELTRIARKQYMPQNNTYHFYLTSHSRISIEVDEQDYAGYNIGDEINIEYAGFSKIYFGYF